MSTCPRVLCRGCLRKFVIKQRTTNAKRAQCPHCGTPLRVDSAAVSSNWPTRLALGFAAAVIIAVLVGLPIRLMIEKRQTEAEWAANEAVALRVLQAQENIRKQEWDKAIAALHEAQSVRDATDFGSATELLETAEKGKQASLFDDALRFIGKHALPQARSLLTLYVASPYAQKVDAAKNLLAELDEISSDERAAALLAGLDDAAIASLAMGQTPPAVAARIHNRDLRVLYLETLQRNLSAEQEKRDDALRKKQADEAKRRRTREEAEERARNEAARKREAEEASRLAKEKARRAEEQREQQERARLAEIARGRRLDVTVNTAGQAGLRPDASGHRVQEEVEQANRVFENVHAYARPSGELEIEFDTDANASWPERHMFLLVRLFDEHGEYLTHFFGKEMFTANASVASRHNPKEMARLQSLLTWKPVKPEDCRLILLHLTGNKLRYVVNERDLHFAAKVEIGFYPYRP